MSWYYAGPEAKPVGPVSLEEVNALRASGAVTADTYVLEQTGHPGETPVWRRCREVFSQGSFPPVLPPLPPALPPSIPPTAPAENALFPSASYPPRPVFAPVSASPSSPSGHYSVRRTNAYCAWGFGLGIIGFVLSFGCIGLLLTIPALIICILGFTQVQRRLDQSGRGLALAGGVLSVLGLLISLGMLAWLVPLAIKEREQAAQQSSE